MVGRRVVLDSELRRSDHGRALVGGSPLRVIRLSDAGAKALDSALLGTDDSPDWSPGTQKLLERLMDAGMVHPIASGPAMLLQNVDVVIPHRNDNAQLATLLGHLPMEQLASVVVVDDGSASVPSPDTSLKLLKHPVSLGPGAARNTGWKSGNADIVCFVDTDVVPQPGWLQNTLAHFADPRVAAVAPRVASAPGPGLLARYEEAFSPLDLGDQPANVRPLARVSYVPAATLLVRRSALEQLDGFDPELRTGEDVDFIWRLHEAGWVVRYEPAAMVHHSPRNNWRALARQRRGYGRSAAALAQRHPDAITPFAASPYSAGAWAAAAFGGAKGIALGFVGAAASTAALIPKLEGRVADARAEAIHLAGKGNLHVGMLTAQATRRAWLPLALLAAMFSRRTRRSLVAAAVIPTVVEWRQKRPGIDPVRLTVLRVADDAAYCRGVWVGMVKARSLRAIRPRFPGLKQLLPGSHSPTERANPA